MFLRVVANVGTDSGIVSWIRIIDGSNRFVVEAEYATHRESSLVTGLGEPSPRPT